MADIAGLFLSPILNKLFEKLASADFVDFLSQRKFDQDLIDELQTALISANKLKEDAEDKQFTDPHVKQWLHKLKFAMYDAQEILDEIATEALQRNLDIEGQIIPSKVLNSISTCFNPFVKKVEAKIKNLVAKLKNLARQNVILGLHEGGGIKPPESTSLVEEHDIFGRADCKKEIVNLLLSGDASGNENVRVIAIVGIGGIGKTTLAQLVNKDEGVKEYFDLKAWVCVSQDFDVFRVTRIVLETVTKSSCNIKDLNRLQQTLEETLMRKKFLLVLDDVWDENNSKWEDFRKPLKSAARESAVIVTTRNKNVALMMSSVLSYHVDKLSDEDCWSLFKRHAFSNSNSKTHPKLEEIGRKIVEKCKGLPLAIKAMGGMLQSKLDVNEWEKILDSNLWDSKVGQNNILPAISLSYKDLSPNLKACFAYCSIFPKDYPFSQKEVVLLWMAEGFLKENGYQTMEEVGQDYFHALRSRSLLEKSSYSGLSFVMHDLIHDLAKSISEQFISSIEVDLSHGIPNETRHLSFWAKDYVNLKKFKALYMPRQLHTFLPLELPGHYCAIYVTNRVLHDLFPMLRCLRVLSLSNFSNLNELPKSISKMKHLRYLNLSWSKIKMLPESICKLCNLQTLNLSYCRNLVVLPRDMRRLISLRHLDISGTDIKEMPIHLGQLQCLQTLTKFVISKHDRAYIQELGKFPLLKGKLSILELQNVIDPNDALQACLKDKKYLEDLEFRWNSIETSKCHKSIFDNLQPHTNLKSLTIKNYCSKSLPYWVGHNSFSSLTFICLENCKYCCNLPPLGQLCSLRDLHLVELSGITKVDQEFYGNHSSLIKPFEALKILRFEKMLNWKEWFPFSIENEGDAFPQLQELSIIDCPMLTRWLPNYLPSLATLEIDGCPQLEVALPRTPIICYLDLSNCNEVLLKELPTGLRRIRIVGFRALESLPKVDWSKGIQELVIENCLLLELPTHLDFSSLKILRLHGCDSLKSFPWSNGIQDLDIKSCLLLELPTHLQFSSLKRLRLDSCDSLKSFPLDVSPKLDDIDISGCKNLESFTISNQYGNDIVVNSIKISNCPKFIYFPEEGIRAPNLTSFWIKNCRSLRSLPNNMHRVLPSLLTFLIADCSEVESFSNNGFPPSLKYIYLSNCKKLFARRMEWGLENYPSITKVSISGESEDVKSFPEQGLLPSSLFNLTLMDFDNMKSLNEKGLQHLTALKELVLKDCPKLKHIPEKGLPASLSSIEIYGCPLLKKQWQIEKVKNWRKIARMDRIRIDGEYIR